VQDKGLQYIDQNQDTISQDRDIGSKDLDETKTVEKYCLKMSRDQDIK